MRFGFCPVRPTHQLACVFVQADEALREPRGARRAGGSGVTPTPGSRLVDRHADVVEDAAQCALGDVTATVHGTVVPRPAAWRMMWWLPLTRATLKPCRSNARTTRMPETEGSRGIRQPR